MIVRRKHFFRIALVALVAAAVLLVAPAIQPTVYAQQDSPGFNPDDVPVPAQAPRAGLGAASYLENCAPCHGETGESDGPVLADLPVPPPAFADADNVWTRSPAEYFYVTKFGRMQNLMPPWGNQLSDGQIWDTVAYAWSLHTNQVAVEAGAAMYAESCAACHGDQGAGDGPEAEGDLADLGDPVQMLYRTDAELDDGWLQAHDDVGGDWLEADRRNVLSFIRTFTLIPPWASLLSQGNGVVEGQVIQGTPDGGDVAGLEVTLDAFADFAPAGSYRTTTDEDGRYRFEELDTSENIVYIVGVTYQDVRYGSNFLDLASEGPTRTVDVTVYEPGDDPSGLAITRANWVIDYQPGALLIGQIVAVGNNSDRAFTGQMVEGADRPVTIGVRVPPGALDFEFQDGVLDGRYVQVGHTIYDTAPVIPGEETRQLFVSYRLPYDGTSAELSQGFLYPVGRLNLLVADLDSLEVEVDQLTPAGEQEIQGITYRIWNTEDLADDANINVSLSGLLRADDADPRPAAAGQTTTQAGATSPATPPMEPVVPIVLGGVFLALMVVAVVAPLRRRGSQDRLRILKASQNELLGEIADLDDRHARGEIDDEYWSIERARLKSRLLDIAGQLSTEEAERAEAKKR